MSRASKQIKKQMEANQRKAQKGPAIHCKLPIWARAIAEVQNTNTPNRIVPNPSFCHPMRIK